MSTTVDDLVWSTTRYLKGSLYLHLHDAGNLPSPSEVLKAECRLVDEPLEGSTQSFQYGYVDGNDLYRRRPLFSIYV